MWSSPSRGDRLDLRLRTPKRVEQSFVLGVPLVSGPSIDFAPLTPAAEPAVDFAGIDVPRHLTPELLSHFPRAPAGGLILDLGCGCGIHRSVCEHAGFEYVGLDHDPAGATVAGDAHALPFADESFDAILSIAVLEHIRYPFVMMREACRVLKPGGRFLGTVAFLEPFHGDSYYHHTHLGTLNSLQVGGFSVERIAPSREWSVLVAQTQMGLFPKMPAALARAIVMPVQWLHELWWGAGRMASPKANRLTRIRNHTGAFTFLASRPIAAANAGARPLQAARLAAGPVAAAGGGP